MPHRLDNKRYLLWLALGTATMAVVMAVMLALQVTQNEAIRKGSQMRMDSVTAMAFQFEREFLRFRQALDVAVRTPDQSDPDDLVLRYDIFVSRLNLLRDNPSTDALLKRPELVKALALVDQLIERTDIELAKMPLNLAKLGDVLKEFNTIGPEVQALSLAADSLVTRLVEQQKNDLLSKSEHIIWLTLAQLVLLLAAAGALVIRQRRQEEQRRAVEKLTQDLRDAKFEAESANRGKSLFLANMSHELRTPFNGILGMLSLLEDSPLNAQQIDHIQTVRSSANHLMELLTDILDVSALESGKLTLKKGPVGLHGLLLKVEALMKPLSADKQLSFTVDVQSALPQWVHADGTRIKQILFNLINNAIKFTTQGNVTLTVRNSQDTGGFARLEFEVSDTGIGISPEGITRLFQRFYQVDSGIDRKFGGTGLGLVISRSLATMMGGGIVVQSTVGFGSVFTLTLPLAACAAPADAPSDGVQQVQVNAALSSTASVMPAPAATDRTQAPVAPPAPRVLVVEDHPVNSEFIGVLLSRLGCESVFCEDGQQALDSVREQMFDLILMDINMPVMDGLTATRAIRALPSAIARVPIIVLTADVMNEARDQALAAGATDFLTKPVQIAQFRATMKNYLKNLAAS